MTSVKFKAVLQASAPSQQVLTLHPEGATDDSQTITVNSTDQVYVDCIFIMNSGSTAATNVYHSTTGTDNTDDHNQLVTWTNAVAPVPMILTPPSPYILPPGHSLYVNATAGVVGLIITGRIVKKDA